MKILLYRDPMDRNVSGETLRSIREHIRELSAAGIPYTLDPGDDYDIMEVNPAYLFNPLPLAEARKKGAAVVIRAGYFRTAGEGTFGFSKKGKRYIRPVMSAVVKDGDRIVLPYSYAVDLAQNAGFANRFSAIPPAADDRTYADVRAFEDQFSLSGEKTVLGTGEMTAEDGFADFLTLAEKFPSYRFIWIGGIHTEDIPEDSDPSLRKKAPRNLTCCDLTSAEILAGGRKRADAVLFPGRREGNPSALLSAMACGALCLVKRDIVYDDVLEDGRNGFAYDDLTEAEALLSVLGTRDLSPVREQAAKTAERYTLYATGERYRRLYEEICGEQILNRIEAYAKAHDRPGMLNVGLFADTYPPDINGVAISVKTLRDQLVSMGHNVYVITTSLDTHLLGAEFSAGVLRLPGIKLKKLYGYRLGNPYSVNAMGFVRKMNLDIVHINSEFSIRLFAETVAKTGDLPIVYTYHTMFEDYTHYVDRGYFEDTAKKLVRWYTRSMTTGYERLIAPTQKTKDALLRYGITKEIDVIPTGIDSERFRPDRVDPARIAEIRSSLGLSDDDFVVCYVGRLAPEKNVDLLIGSIRRAEELSGKLKLVITGYGPSEEELRERVRELGLEGTVLFAGKQKPEDVPYYFALGDVFATASTSETQGLTYIEAMSAGLPVIARADECLSHVLADGVTGFTFTDGEGFARKVAEYRALSPEKKAELRQNDLAKAEEYSLRNFGVSVLRSYYAAIREKRTGRKK